MAQTAGKNKIVQFYIISVAIFVILAIVGYFLADKWGLIPKEASLTSPVSAPQEQAPEWTYVGLPRMTISLGGNASTQMRVDISLEIPSKDAVILEGYMPQILDRFNVFLPRVNTKDLADPTGIFLLRKNMLWEVNSMGMPVVVRDLTLQNLIFN